MAVALIAAILCTMMAIGSSGIWITLIAWSWWGAFWYGLIKAKKGLPGERLAKRNVVFMASVLAWLFAMSSIRPLAISYAIVALCLFAWSVAGFRESEQG